MSNNEEKEIGEWTFGKEIGKGSFAIVYHGWRTGNLLIKENNSCAIKSVIKSKLTAKLLDNLEGEISILKRIHHPNIVGLMDCFKTNTHIHLITSYCSGGDLSCYIKKRGQVPTLEYWPSGIEGVGAPAFYKHPDSGGLDQNVVRSFSGQLAQALLFLRSQDLIHRDIKPQNLLLQPADPADLERGHPLGIPILRVADFGFARNLPAAAMAETLCGSPYVSFLRLYMAPEILRYEKYDAKADLWSVGAVMYEMSTGRPPFRAQNHVELLRKIERSEDKIKFPSPTESIQFDIPRDIKDIIRKLLKRHPIERISFEDFFDWEGFLTFDKSESTNQKLHAEAAKDQFGTSPFSIPSNQSPVRPPLATHLTSPSSSSNGSTNKAIVTTTRRPSFTPKYIVGPSRAVTTTAVPSTSPKSPVSGSPEENALARRTSLGNSVEKLSGLQIGFNEGNYDNVEARITKFQLPANEDSVVGKEYVVVEKNAVEINNLADEMAAAARRQPVVGRLNSKGNYVSGPGPGVFGETMRRVSDPNVNGATPSPKINNIPLPTNYISKFPLPGTSPTNLLPRRASISPTIPTNLYNQTYQQVAQDVKLKDKEKTNQQQQPKGALTRAINLASLKLFGNGTSGNVLTLIKGENNNYNEQKEMDILRDLEELAKKAFVLFDFADNKLYQATRNEDNDKMPESFQHYRQQRGLQEQNNSFELNNETIERLSYESTLLYIRASTMLTKGGELVVKYMTNKTTTQSFSDSLNDGVQWFRRKYNECFDKADFAKARCGNEIMIDNTNQIIFERSMEISRASALDELTGIDNYKCEAAYQTSLYLLEGLLDDDVTKDDEELINKYKLSIKNRIMSIKNKNFDG
ncbi:kinase-like protein [Wallemia mellicola]|uniref:non-specific serine/threonine protein kinase n=1 Tax=Wallemia mellicola TaxID=1708541 RepID=A0A4V4MH72_9BASI|nr:kinase-like protein [Wallemia mellicola]TIC71390.1 kinase-like protein [Wallemia mellicola]